jgi:hypothetical protein
LWLSNYGYGLKAISLILKEDNKEGLETEEYQKSLKYIKIKHIYHIINIIIQVLDHYIIIYRHKHMIKTY